MLTAAVRGKNTNIVGVVLSVAQLSDSPSTASLSPNIRNALTLAVASGNAEMVDLVAVFHPPEEGDFYVTLFLALEDGLETAAAEGALAMVWSLWEISPCQTDCKRGYSYLERVVQVAFEYEYGHSVGS